MTIDTLQSNALEWLPKINSEVVSLLGYSFAKRHNVVAVCEQDSAVELVCVSQPEVEIYTEIRRKLAKAKDLTR